MSRARRRGSGGAFTWILLGAVLSAACGRTEAIVLCISVGGHRHLESALGPCCISGQSRSDVPRRPGSEASQRGPDACVHVSVDNSQSRTEPQAWDELDTGLGSTAEVLSVSEAALPPSARVSTLHTIHRPPGIVRPVVLRI